MASPDRADSSSKRHRSHRGDDGRHRHHDRRSRSPSPHRRHHQHWQREARGEETREERRERKERERRGGQGREGSKRREKGEDEESEHRRRKRDREQGRTRILDEDGEESRRGKETFDETDRSRFQAASSQIPTSDSLSLQSKASPTQSDTPVSLPKEPSTVSSMKRDDWMLSEGETRGDPGNEPSASSSQDYFADLGTFSRQKPPKVEKPNPDELKVSSREINSQFVQGKKIDEYEKASAKNVELGGPGHQWRMMKLKRVYEAAEDEGRSVEEVAVERYGSMDYFNKARTERQFLDDQQGQRGNGRRGGEATLSAFRKPNSDSPSSSRPPSRPMSRQSFRKPGEPSAPSTPQHMPPPPERRTSSFKQSGYDSDSSSKPSTPIPSVFTPTMTRAGSKLRESNEDAHAPSSSALSQAISASQTDTSNSNPPLSAAALNKLSAKVMRAEMAGLSDAAELRLQLERETARAQSGGDQGFSASASHQVGAGTDGHVQVLPTLDGRGRLYDVGKGRPGEEAEGKDLPGNRRKSNKFETRDGKTGDLVRYNADDDEQTLADLVRQERFGAGSADQKSVDAEMATRISSDQAFKDSVDYMDENVERLARKKMKSDAMKRQFAVQDFARTKKALDSCPYCWQEEGARPPRATVISSGTRCYLALPPTEALTEGHCLIVPMQHHLSSLEADDDSWEEIKNFMKCLIQMAASRKQGVVFYETVKSLKQQKHTVIEAVPLDSGLIQELPGYFKQSILSTGDEWSQNKKLIEFSTQRPFRKSMVPQLPYFMVQWDYKGERGYGHVIEDGDGFDGAGGGDGFEMAESSKGGGEFPFWFAAEIIGNLLELEPRRWRKARRMQGSEQESQRSTFHRSWKPFDWTAMLDQDQQPV